MSTKSIKLLAFIVLLVHGIGHLQGVVSSLGVQYRSSSSNISWLLKGLGDKANRMICLVLYFAAGIFGILAALSFKGLLIPASGWTLLALITAVISTVCLVLFPRALAMFFNKAGAIAVNLVIYYSVLLNGNWPPAIFEE
jgi:hypothetical protein